MGESFTPGQNLSMFDTGDNPGAAKLNANWLKLDLRAILPATSFPATYPALGFVLRTDQKILYQNTGTLNAPAWTVVLDGSGGTLPDATASVKGVLKLAGDLGGSAAVPTVPGLAAKVPTTRNIATTAPLGGGGALSADLTLTVAAATTSAPGVVQLASDGGTGAGTVPQGNDSRFSAASLGNWWFGDGVDGDLSLGADASFALHSYIKRYHNVSLNGHILSNNSGDKLGILYVSNQLDLGTGGTITNGTTPAGGGGGGSTGPCPVGGAGGGSIGSIYVFAKKIIGTGTISAKGRDGANGSPAVGSGNGGGAVGGAGSTAFVVFGNASGSFLLTAAGGGHGGEPGDFNGDIEPGGAGGQGYNTGDAADVSMAFVDYQNLVHGISINNSTGSNSGRYFASVSGAGGGCGGLGGSNQATMSGGGGGGGGGAAGFVLVGQNGGTGGNGGSALNSGGSGGGGAGGGGGGSGSVVVVVTTSAPATLTITADGGKGGDGGTAFNNGGGGGGGGGGCGGAALYVGPSGPTVTALAGSGGLGKARTGTDGTAGTPGITIKVLV